MPVPTVPVAAGSGAAAARARDAALIVPVAPAVPADDEDLDGEPDVVLPQAPQPRPTRRHQPTPRSNTIRAGDLICGDCGQGNAPARRFCARCGEELREAEVAPTPWWHRFRRRRGPRVVPLDSVTGEPGGPAPAPSGGLAALWARARVVLGVLVCLSCMLYATYAPFRHTVDDRAASVRRTATDFLESRYDPVRPSEVRTEDSARGSDPKHLVDLSTATYWAAPFDARSPGGAEKAVLVVGFDRVVALDQLIVTAGAGDEFTGHGRPRQMLLTFTNEKRMRLQLKDTAKPQKFPLKGATAIKTVRIEITDVYPSEKGGDVTVAELEFFSLLS
ncbi:MULTISPECIES: NADase-type glycan-binding domain-containing protein [unclassified Streptomyces]|uniref:NADase-type glycan-binding domain-containing protein n=1 Tax=unclassified Streptomyces TaxID=2593676 RepID=UPI003825143A